MTARALPSPPAPAGDVTVTGYGLQLLRFLVAERCAATLTRDQLELADHAAAIAVCGQGAYAPDLFDRISDVRHLIAVTLRLRAQLDQEPPDAGALVGQAPPERPNLGPMAPLVDAPIVRPPAPSYARPQPVTIDF